MTMPAAAGNHPGHQPGTTQARHVTGQGQLPCAHKGPNFVSVIRLQLAAGAAGGGRSAAYPDTGAPLVCGNQTRFGGVRLLANGNSRICPDSAVARLRCLENGGGLSCSPSRSGWTSRVDQPCGCTSTIMRRWPDTTRRADPCRAPGGGESAGTCVAHVPYAVEQDEDGVWCASAQLRPGVGAVGDGATAEAAVADLRDALEALLAEVGPPDELTLTLDVA